MATKKVAKKVAAPKPAKVAKPAKKSKLDPAIARDKKQNSEFTSLVSFSVTAVIPTQQYGNIQPKIEVIASSIEAARACVMPVIEDLYKTYAEMPLNGRELKFLGKVTEEVKVVTPPAGQVLPPNPSAGTNTPPAPATTNQTQAPQQDLAAAKADAPQKPKSEAVLKAEKAISLAMSADAALAIQDQIEKSVKIAPEDKPALVNLVLAKRNQYK